MSLLKVNTVQTDKLQSVAGVNRNSVLQLLQATKITTFSTTSTTFVDIPDLSISITPSSVSSKILVRYSVNCTNNSNVNTVYLTLVRGSTEIFIGDGSSQTFPSTTQCTNYGFSAAVQGVHMHNANTEFLDSPATTSPITYKVQMRVGGGAGYVNRRGDGNTDGTASSITVMEIAQ